MNIYVGNLSRMVTEDALKNLFEAFGQVQSIRIIKDKFSGEPRGFGFVDMPNKEEAEKAIAHLNGTELEGMRLKVNEARQTQQRSGGMGRGGGHRSGGLNRDRGGQGGYGQNRDRGGFGGRNGGGSGRPSYGRPSYSRGDDQE
jgi:RNA recognition motif-containing protein